MTFPYAEEESPETDPNLLYPGARWERVAKGKASVVTVLMLTNVGLSAEKQSKHPIQVVFQRDNGQILSQEAVKFVASRSYVPDPDERVGKLVGQLLGSGEDDDDLDIDAIPLGADESEEAPTDDSVEDAVIVSEDTDEVPTEDDYIPVFEPATVLVDQTEIDLDQSFQGFEQYPFNGTDTTVLSRLTFTPDDNLTISSLVDALGKVGRFTLDTDLGRYFYDLVEIVDVKRRVTGAGNPMLDAFVLVTEVPDPMEAIEEAEIAPLDTVAEAQKPAPVAPGQAPVTHIIPQVQVAPTPVVTVT